MAFFGEDGLQRQLKQAQRDLMTKDGQIASMHLVTRDKDDLIKKLRLEIERMTEDSENMSKVVAGPSDGGGQNSAEYARLASQLKEAQQSLNSATTECAKLREEARQNSIQLHRNRMGKSPISPTFSQTPGSPASIRSASSRRRSTSLSSDNRVKDLEAELASLRLAAGSPAMEIDALKAQLANVRRDLNKAINEKMALEARSRKDIEAVKSQLDDANFELDNMRRDAEDGGSVSKKDVERQKKSWEGERQELQMKIGKLETIATERQSEINDLQSSAEEASRLAMELEQERSRKAPAPAPTLQVDTTELNRLQLKVAELQSELTQARNASTTASTSATQSTTTDLQVRRLQRELEKARRDISALEQSLEQSEEENQSLRTYVPLPGSPGRGKIDDGRAMQLESENEDLRAELESLKQTMATLRVELERLKSVNAGLAGLQPHMEALKAEAAQKEGSIRAMREETQTLQDQLSTESKKLLESSAQTASLSSQLEVANSQVEDLTQRINDATKLAADMETQLATGSKAIEESVARHEQLEGLLADAKQTIEELQSRPSTEPILAELTEARAHIEQLVAEKTVLEESMLSVTREKDDLVEVANRLTLEITGLGAQLSSQLEELEEERLTARNASRRLEETEAMIASGDIQLAKLSDDQEAAITHRASLEQKIADLQDTLANRSTESEADARDSELAELRTELDEVKTALADKESELQREVQIIAFTKEQDSKVAKEQLGNLQSELDTALRAVVDKEASLQYTITALRAEITTLEQRVAALQAELSSNKDTPGSTKTLLPPVSLTKTPHHTPDHVGLLYAKIQSLRADRDGLRQELSFAQNESRFTVSAAQADRKSALEELEKVKSHIASETAIRDGLEAEINTVRTQLNDKETRLKETKALYTGVSVDKGNIANAIAQFESDAAEAKNREARLIAQLQDSQQTIIELNHAMVIMRSNTDTDKRHRKISMERKAEMSMITETSDGLAASEGVTVSFGASRRPGHTRTRSEIAALVLPDQAQISALTGKVAELEAEIKMLSGKLERRNATIAGLKKENEKLKMADELNKESADDFDDLIAERDQLQATLDQRTQDVDSLRSEVDIGRSAMEAQIARLAQLETAVLSSRQETAQHQQLAEEQTMRVSEVTKELDTLRQTSHTDMTRLEEMTATTGELRSSFAESERQSTVLVLDILKQRKCLQMATRAWRNASAGLSTTTTALGTATAQITDLTAKVDAFDAERSAMSEQLVSYTQRGKLLDTANEKVRVLEGQLATLQEECVAMSEQLDEKIEAEAKLSGELADATTDREAREEMDMKTRKLEEQLTTARGEVQKLETDMAIVRAELDASTAAKRELENALTEQVDLAKTELLDTQAKLGSKHAELEAIEERIRSYSAGGSEVPTDTVLAQLTSLVAGLQAELSAAEANLSDATHQLQASEVKVAEAEADTVKASQEKDAGLAEARAELEGIKASRDLATSRASELETQLAELKKTIEELTSKLEEAFASSTDRSLALQASNADLQQNLESSVRQSNDLRVEIEAIAKQRDQLTSAVATLDAELVTVRQMSAGHLEARETLEAQKQNLEREAKNNSILLTNKDSVIEKGAEKLAQLEQDLLLAREEISATQTTLDQRMGELSALQTENAQLQASLADAATTPNGDASALTELNERIEELENSLMAKTQEVDEADDRTREAYKANVKLEKKLAKLTRQLTDKTLEENTKRNRVIPVDPVKHDTKPISAQAPALQPAPGLNQRAPIVLASTRTPLRPVNQLDPSTQIPAASPTSLKRNRDTDNDEKPLPADAIMLPPAAPPSNTRKTQPASFTPKRNLPIGAENTNISRTVFGGPNATGTRGNIFAPRP